MIRTIWFKLRLSKEEHEALTAHAADLGVTLSTAVRLWLRELRKGLK